jgi:pyruvate,water dikinase
MKLARERVPGRGVAKRCFLQTIDIARMSARHAGVHLAAEGLLSDPDDVFYLTGEELIGGLPADVYRLIAARRERRACYQRLRFRTTEWTGMPHIVPEGEPDGSIEDGTDLTGLVEGTGASPGVVEGAVRVVEDPSFLEVEPGEILVAATTDPSWCSIMYVSAALVVDLGGMLSHAAVVAREIDIPCVVNTGDGTRRLRTGDRVRVDGGAGTVEILSRS